MSFGLYLHVPFCEQHCHYCTFPISLSPASAHRPYIERLKKELERDPPSRAPSTIYLGGGTPSLIAPDLLADLLGRWRETAGEVSIEVNPGTLTTESVDAYLEMGIDRVSLGAQSFDPNELRAAGRLHSPEDTVADYERLRERGFQNISFDLIAGLPGQRHEVWDANLDWVIRLGPDHVSVYLLELEDSALWARQAAERPGDESSAWFYRRAADRLADAGYRHYETSSWARPGMECRHNIGYWTGVEYRGAGIGAHSFVGNRRFWNFRNLAAYAAAIDNDGSPVEDAEERTVVMQLEEAFLLGLRRAEGFSADAVARELGIDYPQEWFERVDSLSEAGLIEFDGQVVRLAPDGWLLATSITEELLCPSLLSICEATR